MRRVRSRNDNPQQLVQELRLKPEKPNAQSNERSRQSRTPKESFKESQRLSRTPIEAVPLCQRRDHEGPVLGLSRSQDTQAQFSQPLDPTYQCRVPSAWADVQPVHGR